MYKGLPSNWMDTVSPGIKKLGQKVFVASIVFGTTYSGYAFSSINRWTDIYTQNWQSENFVSNKTSTSLLLKKDYSVAFFGSEAEDRYLDLTSKNDHQDYYFFQGFKKILHEDISGGRHILCKDINGETLEAGVVFMQSIKYLKNILLENIRIANPSFHDDDIQYVLTVPGIWGYKAKMFMMDAATMAGIKKENLTIVLELEAASIYCQYFHLSRFYDSSSPSLGVVQPGTKYMIVNLGGDTADITVHQKCEDNTLEEVLPVSGGPWGGKSVDDAFLKFLTELVGEKNMTEFKEEKMDDYLDLMRSFERKKRSIKPYNTGMTSMTIPNSLRALCIKSHGVMDFREVIERNELHRNNVKYGEGKLKWDYKYFKGFFKKTIDSIIKHIDELFEENVVRDVNIIVMVGGFSGCMLVQDAIRRNFDQKRVIIPIEPGMAVIKGAVYFGHVPDAISRRSARYTYGIQIWPEFRQGCHPESKKINVRGSMRCRDVFFKLVTKGEKVMPGYTKSQIFQALNSEENYIECGVFISDQKNPNYVDEPGCSLLGALQVPLSVVGKQTSCEIEESLIFGETELRFQAKDVYSGVQCEVVFDLLKD